MISLVRQWSYHTIAGFLADCPIACLANVTCHCNLYEYMIKIWYNDLHMLVKVHAH